MIDPRVEIDSAAAMAAFNRLLQEARNPHDGLDAVGRALKTKTQLGFVNSVNPYGQPWAPLKVRQGQPLRDNNHLMDSFDYQIEGDSVVLGTNLPYAPTHQFGVVIRPKSTDPKARLYFLIGNIKVFAREVTIPPREMLPLDGLPADWEEDVVAEIAGVIEDKWAGRSFNGR